MKTAAYKNALPKIATPSRTDDVSFRFLKDIAQDLARGEVNFPTFSLATVKVRKALDDPNVSADHLARIIGSEPLISAKLVHLANSAALNQSGKPVADVKTAVMRVGHSTVRTVAVAVAYDQLRAGRELAQFRGKAEAAWRHSVEVASLCYVIAANLTRISADEGLFAGLVHDIGYFYLLSLAPRYPELEAHPEALDAVLREWHPSIGQAVLHSFGLSPAVMDAVGEHEIASPHSPPRSMTDVVRLANLAAAQTNPARDPAAPVTPLEDPQLRTLIAESHDHLRSLVAALHS